MMKYSVVLLFLVVVIAVGCGQKSANLQDAAVPPDTTLFENGMKYLQKNRFIQARLALQTLINTYPDSEFTPISFLSIADSFYREGGTSNLVQAESQFKDFIIFYPTHEMADDAQMKVAAINFRLMRAPDRDPTNARKAMDELRKFLRDYPDSPLAPTAGEVLWEVEENLAAGVRMKGDFYYKKKRFEASSKRYEQVVRDYKNFSGTDATLYSWADSLEKKGSVDQAATIYERIAREFPFSQYHEKAIDKLTVLERDVPQVDEAAAERHLGNQRPGEGFSFFDPVRNVWKTFTGGKDIYEVARQRAEERENQELSQDTSGGDNK
jgi:outer membrane protein assembly factor BamD